MTLDKRCEGMGKDMPPPAPQPETSPGLQAALERFARIQHGHHEAIDDVHTAFVQGLRAAYPDTRLEVLQWQVGPEYGVQLNIDAPAQDMEGLLAKYGIRRETADSTRLEGPAGTRWGELSSSPPGSTADRTRYRLPLTALTESQAPAALAFIDDLLAIYGIQRAS